MMSVLSLLVLLFWVFLVVVLLVSTEIVISEFFQGFRGPDLIIVHKLTVV